MNCESKRKPLLIGLTGGIACGKSAVSKRLASKGALIVDADVIARNILTPDSEGLKQVVEVWGKDILNDNHELDRVKLGKKVFADPKARKILEGITHPLIAQESTRQVQEAMAKQPPLVVYDAALLIEAGRAEYFRPLIVVSTTANIQIERLRNRDQLSEKEARARIESQMSLAEKEALADHLIFNDGDWHQLDQQINALWHQLMTV